MVYTEQSLFKWHINRKIVPNERLSEGGRLALVQMVDNQ